MKGEKMKKLLLVLMVVALASFLFVGCVPTTTPAEGEGEGEGEGATEVTVDIADSIVLDGKTYVSGGAHDITVTFPAPVSGAVTAYVGFCSGDYSKGLVEDLLAAGGISAVLFPNADKTIWTGSAEFLGWGLLEEPSGCCASYVFVSSGECEDEVCIQFPVIVDDGNPYAKIAVVADACECEGIALTFSSTDTSPACADAAECCGDDCSGLASWVIDLYASDPFDECCDTPCKSPVSTCSDTVCPVACITGCLPDYNMTGYVATDDDTDGYYVLTTLLDEVGNKTRYYVILEPFDEDFVTAVKAANAAGNSYEVALTEYEQDKFAEGTTATKPGVCSWFCTEINTDYDTGEYGFCVDTPQNVLTPGLDVDPCQG
jgi:predicted small secreted protein